MTVRSVAATDTLETFRTTFNTQASSDIGDMATLSSTISATSLVGALNELESEVTSFGVHTIANATDLGAAPATGDSFVIRDASAAAIREMTVANLFTTPTITTPVITEIDSGSTITLDATTDINLDAGGGDVFLKDDGTTFGSLTATGSNLIIKSGTTTAMTFSGANVTIAGNLTVSGSTTTVDSSTVSITTGFVFEGSTADSFETTLTTTDPTADRTITLPNLTGTVSLLDATETLENKTLTSPTINSPTITTPIFTGAGDMRGTLVFEGATADSFETTLTVVDPTADRTISLPNATDTLVGKATTDTMTNKTLTSPAINSPTIIYEGSTADSFETTIGVVDPTADRTINFANAAGTLQPFATASTTAISTTVSELNLIDGGTARGTDAVASGDGLLVNDGGTMKMTNVDTVSTYFASHSVGGGNIVTTGALNSGSITSGFGAIDNGSSTLDTGAITTTGITNTGSIIFEGSTADSWETTFSGGNPSADITITLPTQAGTVVVSNTTDGNDVQLDSLGLNTAASGTAGELRATNDITAFYSSDISLKENIVEIPSALDMVDKIRGVFFDWKDDYIDSKGGEDGYFMRKKDVGLIAQEVEAVLPEVVGTRKDGIKAIKYDRLVPLLLQAIKELKEKI
tara:strand:+ start:653 stop:2566 length:1914 start_codon:yes stop_codon:yes gene_type:complete